MKRSGVWTTVLHGPHLRRTGLVALVVGVWLTLFNLGGGLVHGPWDGGFWLKVGLNFLTPWVVSNLGLVARRG